MPSAYPYNISEVNRTITCNRCGLALEPFELVLDRARNGENIVSEIKSLYTKRDALLEAVAKLEREEKNAKARLRAAGQQYCMRKMTLKILSRR